MKTLIIILLIFISKSGFSQITPRNPHHWKYKNDTTFYKHVNFTIYINGKQIFIDSLKIKIKMGVRIIGVPVGTETDGTIYVATVEKATNQIASGGSVSTGTMSDNSTDFAPTNGVSKYQVNQCLNKDILYNTLFGEGVTDPQDFQHQP
jgi:hypothetical protein